jgi:hypothetical protein
MRCATLYAAFVSVVLFVPATSRAEIKVAFDVNRGRSAAAAFGFEKVPSPSRSDAASQAKFSILDGSQDSNGGDVNRLNDGAVPSDEDEPGANFFFAAGGDGGRLLLDLGRLIDIRQINSYSWHPSTRGPQVYKLYADNPEAKNFDAQTGKSPNLTQAGWTRGRSVSSPAASMA